MSDELYTLKDLAAFIAKEEEEEGKLPYEAYLTSYVVIYFESLAHSTPYAVLEEFVFPPTSLSQYINSLSLG